MDKRPLWQSDLTGGSYRNPIVYADYSDPDICRVGGDYFMVASSFCNVPAIPLLHSKDLVNWKLINYVLEKLPSPKYDAPAHGHGVWAPAIRHHGGKFWVCFPMPDEGIYMSTATDPFGKWSEPFPVREGSGWIDPCPFWDDDGRAYLASAFAKSRCGIKSILNLAEMKPDGTGLVDDGRHIFDGRNTQPTIEGPKLYKRGGYYYILAPAGSVKTGWQTALRSRNIWGPYEEKIVMMQSGTGVNGPHQGGLVDTPEGEWWFVHFQDVGVCGRIVHLQPVQWVDDWPIIGADPGGDTCGHPVYQMHKPAAREASPQEWLHYSDDFSASIGLQWQWNANPGPSFHAVGAQGLQLFAQPSPGKLCDQPHLLLQKFGAPAFRATAELDSANMAEGSTAGLVVLGRRYGALAVYKAKGCLELRRIEGEIHGDGPETSAPLANLKLSGTVYLRLTVNGSGGFAEKVPCTFSYSVDQVNYIELFDFSANAGVWVGAKDGLFCNGASGFVTCRGYMVEPL